MTYAAYTDRVLPYHLDGTVVKALNAGYSVVHTYSDAQKLELNDEDYVSVGYTQNSNYWIICFFPELVDVTGFFAFLKTNNYSGNKEHWTISTLQWSADTTNGADGTWTGATLPGGYPIPTWNVDGWRTGIKSVTGVSGAKAIRFLMPWMGDSHNTMYLAILHLYGHKTSGQTPDDIIFLDPEDADAEYTIPLSFGDVPSGTPRQRQLKVQNVSPTLTATTVVVTVVDPDGIITIGLSDTGPWLTEQTTASLAPDEKSVVYYIKCETAAPPVPLGPNRAPIKVVVGSWA